MSVAYIVQELFEETLRQLDGRVKHELWRVGCEMSYWLRRMLMEMPCDDWRGKFERQIAKMAREHVYVTEESCQAWIERLREANEAAEEDARTFGSAEAVRARTREYFKWPDPPQYPNDKPAPFDPDYPQLRRTGNGIMEEDPPDQWVERAHFALQNYRVPQEIKDAFVGWLEDEQRKVSVDAVPEERAAAHSASVSRKGGGGVVSDPVDTATGEPPGLRRLAGQLVAGREDTQSATDGAAETPARAADAGPGPEGNNKNTISMGDAARHAAPSGAPAAPARQPARPTRRATASRFQYVPGAINILIPRKPAWDRYAAAGGKLDAMFNFKWSTVPDQFVTQGVWRFPCLELGVVQIAKATSNLWKLNIGWAVDGGVPYPFPEGRNVIIDPFRGPPRTAFFEDSPGAPASSMLNFGTIRYLRQDFEAHVVCLKGIERGATYGGVRWWVQHQVRAGLPAGNAATDYVFSSDAQIISGPPSKDWCNAAFSYFPTGG